MGELMSDDNKTNEVETDAPFAPGLDEVWHANNTVDVAEREKQAVAAEDFQAHRRWHYFNTGQDVGGFAQPAFGGGREIYRLRGRGIDWR